MKEDIKENIEAQIRPMRIEDYPNVYRLWKSIKGLGIRSIDDSKEGVERFIQRNPSTSIVAEAGGEIVGAILCGHDGRRGCFYHVCVKADFRKRGIGKAMAAAAMKALQAEQINKVCLIAFADNEIGNRFWKSVGWTFRDDLNYYDFTLNENNVTGFIEEEGKCEAFPGMPSDDMPMSGSEGALPYYEEEGK